MQVLKHFEERPLSSEERRERARNGRAPFWSLFKYTQLPCAIAQCFTQQIILHGPDSSPPGLDG